MAVNIGAANISKIRLAEQGSNPATPASGFGFLFVKNDGVYYKDDAGVVTGPFGASGAGLDTTAIHDNVASEISAIAEKTTPVSADLLLIEDSAAANVKKRVQIGNLPGGAFSGARVWDNTGQVIASGVHVALTFGSERYDTDAYHSTATNPTRLTIPTTGKYHVGGTYYLPGGGGNYRQLTLRVNGTTFIVFDRRAIAGGGNDNGLSISTDYDFTAGDYVELMAAQDSGGNLTTDTTNAQAFWIHRL